MEFRRIYENGSSVSTYRFAVTELVALPTRTRLWFARDTKKDPLLGVLGGYERLPD